MINVLALSKQYSKAPSEILGITDSYTAFCFDEAALYLLGAAAEYGIPAAWETGRKNTAAEEMIRQEGVIFIDRRRNNSGDHKA
jgi:hypothetical protein